MRAPPIVPCDVCGKPATILVRDETLVTMPGDAVDTYMPGAVRAGCNDHPVTQQVVVTPIDVVAVARGTCEVMDKLAEIIDIGEVPDGT